MSAKGVLFRGPLCAVLAALCWGAAVVMSKGALSTIPVGVLFVVQLVAAISFMGAMLAFRQMGDRSIRDTFMLSWLGLLEPGVAYLLSLLGLVENSAMLVTLIGATEAVMILALSAVLFRVPVTIKVVVLSATAFVGLLFALGITRDALGVGNWNGILLVFLGTFAAALYVVISGHVLGERDPVLVLAGQQIVALVLAVGMLILTWNEGMRSLIYSVPSIYWMLAIVSGILQYSLAFWFFLIAVRLLKPNIAGNFLNLIPIFGLIGAFTFLGEALSVLQIVGVCVTILALFALSLAKAS
ncbi:MAG: DMT family transporter [Fimbriimonadaceae bacterium]